MQPHETPPLGTPVPGNEQLDALFMPPQPSRWPGRLLWGTVGIGVVVGAVYGGQWLLANHANIELVAPWQKKPDAVSTDPTVTVLPPGGTRSPGAMTSGGNLSRSRVNNCAGSKPDPDCPPAVLPSGGPSPESEISRIRAANSGAPSEIKATQEVSKGGTQHLEVGRPRNADGSVATAAGPVVDKGQECDLLRVRIGEIDQMLTQNYPAKVKDGLRNEQKNGRARMGSLGC
jgi:hypothetical protein